MKNHRSTCLKYEIELCDNIISDELFLRHKLIKDVQTNNLALLPIKGTFDGPNKKNRVQPKMILSWSPNTHFNVKISDF